MPKPKEPVNPFYLALVALGVLFTITACAYFAMALRAVAAAGQGPAPNGLMTLMDRRGLEILAGELVLLALATGGAMWLDGVRSRQPTAQGGRSDDQNEAERSG